MCRRRMYKLPRFGLAGILLCWALAPRWALAADPTVDPTATLEIRVEGVDDDLRRNILARLSPDPATKGKLTESEIRRTHARAEQEIEKAIQPFGFYRPVITGELLREGAGWIARYLVDPGPPIRVDSLDVRISGDGANDPVFRDQVSRLPIRRGDVLIHTQYEQAKLAFSRAALERGYLDGRFEQSQLRIDLDRYAAAVVLHYATGTQFLFGRVAFQQDVVDPRLLEGYVTFRQGEPLDFGRLVELEQALGNSPYFTRVEVRPRRDLAEGNQLPIVVDLTASKPEKYTFGMGYGTDNGPHARGMVEFRRLNRAGHRADIEGTFSAIEQSGAAKYQIPWPYPRTDVLTVSGGYAMVKTDVSEQETRLAGVGLARIRAGWQENFAVFYRRERFEVGSDQGHDGFLVPEASWSRLRVNDPVDPSDGGRLRFRISGASQALFSAVSYTRVEGEGRWLRTFGGKSRLLGRTEAGYNWTSAFHQLPPSARFFAGGAQSVRGFGYNQLGGRDAAGRVIGGEALAVASLEYEYRFTPQWGLATFYDIGNAMRSFGDPLEQGAGLGARWVSPIGLVRIDLGVPLTEPRTRVEFHLSIGPAL